jgi:hypothetical protein
MRKYSRICDIMMAEGYEIAEEFRDEATGWNYWLFKQPAA